MSLQTYAKSMSILAKEGAKIAKRKGLLKKIGPMCHECACKFEQPHTLCYFLAADKAGEMLQSGGDFNCHTSTYQDAGKECSGFQYAKLALEEHAKNKIKALQNIISYE